MASGGEDCNPVVVGGSNGLFFPEGDVPTDPLQPYTVLTEADIRQRQEELISLVSSTLSLTTSSSTLLLSHNSWDAGSVIQSWLSDEPTVRSTVGLLEQPSDFLDSVEELICAICFNTHNCASLSAAACGHNFCTNCLVGYIGSAIKNGPGCLTLRCPHPSCSAAIDRSMVEKLSTSDDRTKYARYLVRSYVESSKTSIKWCPSPGCEYAIEFEGSGTVQCRCLYLFCWVCTEEAHRPASCDNVAKWVEKTCSGSENINWLMANSKPCPECKRAIEKDQGCMHMICTPPCNFEFCWLCLGAWRLHGDRSGGYYGCNRYEEAQKTGVYGEDEARRRNARMSLSRYTSDYEQWSRNHKLMVKAQESLRGFRNGGLNELMRKLYCDTEEQLKFIIDAWVKIVECRLVLKWSYAYGYFVTEHETCKRMGFEQFVREAELGIDRLYRSLDNMLNDDYDEEDLCLDLLFGSAEEEELSELRNSVEKKPQNAAREKLNELRNRLTNLTHTTGAEFENLVRILESGLDGIVCDIDDPANKSSIDLHDDINQVDHWYCDRCTFANPITSNRCQMCNSPDQDSDDDMGFALHD